ncbi:hypothetical protein BC835DRAFT_1274129 [Cytidiella melzeri]|nr:hypothetical protein BC835DRAFT_1274129 [Cytidiella melzeri]
MRLPTDDACAVLIWLLFVAISNRTVLANTEIVNIVATQADGASFPQALGWLVLSSSSAEHMLRAQPAPLNTPSESICISRGDSACRHEMWAVLELDSHGWTTFGKFTLRVSWPAFHPTDFFIQTYSPQEAAVIFGGSELPQPTYTAVHKTRRQYARILLVDTGTRVLSKANTTAEATPFMIILEPLYLTVLPASVVPTLLFLMPLVLVASLFVVPRVHRYLYDIAKEVRSEGMLRESRKHD